MNRALLPFVLLASLLSCSEAEPETPPIRLRSDLSAVLESTVQLEGPMRLRVTPLWGGRHATLELGDLRVVVMPPEGMTLDEAIPFEEGEVKTVTGRLTITNNPQRKLVERPVAEGGELRDPTRETPLALQMTHPGADPAGAVPRVTTPSDLARALGARTVRVAGRVEHLETGDGSRAVLVLDDAQHIALRVSSRRARALRNLDGRSVVLEGRLVHPDPGELAHGEPDGPRAPAMALEVRSLP